MSLGGLCRCAWEPSNSHTLDSDHSIECECDSSALHCEIASSDTRRSSGKPVVLVTLGGCHLLDGLVACDSIEAHEKIVRCSGEVIVGGIMLTPREP